VARGGFATVYRAHDRQRQAAAAVKIFHVKEEERLWMLRRFDQEISALERIRHPNVVQLLAAGQMPTGEPYLAMEFVEGITLRERLRLGPLPLADAARAARELGEALAAIHAQGVIHRDIKPENLMLTPDGRLRVIDFSIAIARDPRATVHALSRAAGSLLYMAPEQVFGYASAGTDVYSFALVVFEMITGQSAGELGLGAASGALGSEVAEALRRALPQLPPAATLLEALTLDVQSRPRDAAAFGRRLAEWLSAPPQ